MAANHLEQQLQRFPVEKILDRIDTIDQEIGSLERLLEGGELYHPVTAIYHEPTDLPAYREQQQRHGDFKPRLQAYLASRFAQRSQQMEDTRKGFMDSLQLWTRRIRRIEAMNGEKDEVISGGGSIAASYSVMPNNIPPTSSSSSTLLPGNTGATGRMGRRSGGFGDAVRSEEELNRVLLSLLEQERENPATRWMATLAVIPPMLASDGKMITANANICTPPLFFDRNSAVDGGDGNDDYDDDLMIAKASSQQHFSDAPPSSPVWTDLERKIFVAKFLIFPKNFRKIASYLPFKATSDCVQFYYRNKKTLRLKQALQSYRKGFVLDSMKMHVSKRVASNQPGSALSVKLAKKSRPVGRPPKGSQHHHNSSSAGSGGSASNGGNGSSVDGHVGNFDQSPPPLGNNNNSNTLHTNPPPTTTTLVDHIRPIRSPHFHDLLGSP